MQKRIKVLHLRDTYEIGGPGKTILETYSFINRDRFDYHIAAFKTRNEKAESPFIAEAKKRGIPLHIIESYNQYDIRVISGLAGLVRSNGFDILHTHETKSDFLGYAASRFHKIPLVTTLHGWIGNSRKQRFMTALDKKIVKRFDRVIAVSTSMRDSLISSGFDESKTVLLRNCIVTARYGKNGNRGYLGEVTKAGLSRPVIGTVGRLSREKGHMDFVKAASIVLSKGHAASFVIVGDGPERERLKAEIEASGLTGRVHLAGYLSEMPRVYQDLDLMVLPSYTEGFPNVVLESFSMRVPVIATAVGGTPEIITEGETGVLIEPGRPDVLAQKIVEFINDRARFARMAEKGRDIVKAEYDFSLRTRKLEGIYEELYDKNCRQAGS